MALYLNSLVHQPSTWTKKSLQLSNIMESQFKPNKLAPTQIAQEHPRPDNLQTGLWSPEGKRNFLVFKNNRYLNIPTTKIAYFYVNYKSSVIVCFDGQEYFVQHSLDRIEKLVSEKLFFRLSRQYLINFNAVKEAEHYFARKLLVHSFVSTRHELLVSREKAHAFLVWLDNR
jgi:two-component system, LytTR family, response regulator LytT